MGFHDFWKTGVCMKKGMVFLLSMAFLLVLSSCENPLTEKKKSVTIEVKNFWWSDVNNVRNEPSEYRLIGDFNDWGNNSGTNLEAVWENAIKMPFDEEANAFRVTLQFEEGETIKFTFLSKHVNTETNELSSFGWDTPDTMKYENGEWIFSPHDYFEDNGMGNGGKNAVYKVK